MGCEENTLRYMCGFQQQMMRKPDDVAQIPTDKNMIILLVVDGSRWIKPNSIELKDLFKFWQLVMNIRKPTEKSKERRRKQKRKLEQYENDVEVAQATSIGD